MFALWSLLLDIVFAKAILFTVDAKVATIIEVTNAATNNAKDISLFILSKNDIKLIHNYNFLSIFFYIFIFVNHNVIIMYIIH